jgi:hypothetical protein
VIAPGRESANRGPAKTGNSIPLPEDYLALVADKSHTRHVDREREWAQRGEESQEEQ